MSLIVEFEVESPVLEATASAVPDMTFETVELRTPPEGQLRLVFWAIGEAFDAMETSLEEDPTVADFELLSSLSDRRLYRVTFSEAGASQATFPAAVEQDIIFLHAETTADGTFARAQVPSREALRAYQQQFRDQEIPFRLERLYAADGEHREYEDRYGITEKQREALLHAWNDGYFEIPRQTSAVAMAAELGISDQALSARLRRGHSNLIESTLAADDRQISGLDVQG